MFELFTESAQPLLQHRSSQHNFVCSDPAETANKFLSLSKSSKRSSSSLLSLSSSSSLLSSSSSPSLPASRDVKTGASVAAGVGVKADAYTESAEIAAAAAATTATDSMTQNSLRCEADNVDSCRTGISAAYDKVAHWRQNLFNIPCGSAGGAFVDELARLIKKFTERYLSAISCGRPSASHVTCCFKSPI